MDDDRPDGITRLIDALRPWRNDLVLVGGWAHRLYRLDPRARVPAHRPLQTKDADVAFNPCHKISGNIADALQAAGFEEVLSGEHVPPVSEYRLGEDDAGFYVEFLAPLSGSDVKRNGTRDATVVRAGVTAQKVRYLDILLTSPWTIHIGAETGIPGATLGTVLVANPASFIGQKLLIKKYRTPEKQAQDALYVHDTIELFTDRFDELRQTWCELVRPAIGKKVAKDLQSAVHEQYGAVNDVIRTAARIPQDRHLIPERMQRICAYALQRLFED